MVQYPPPGAYRPPGAYPPPGAYAPAYGYLPARQSYRLGGAFSWAWHKFTDNAGAAIVSTLLYGIALFGLGIINRFIFEAVTSNESSGRSPGEFDDFAARFASYITSAGGIATVLGWIAIVVALGVIQSGYFAGLLDIADGRPVNIGSFFKPRSTGNVVVASMIVELLTAIGFGLCLIGGILARALLLFTIVALVDRRLSALDAVKTSYGIAKANFGKALLALLVIYATFFVGALACGVGVLIGIPVAALFLTYTYRLLSGGQVIAAVPPR
jgi:uncharacterized membrane protein